MEGKLVLAREAGELRRVRLGARGIVAAYQFEQGRVQSCKRERAGMSDVRGPPLHAVDERNRAIDLPERPQRDRKIAHRADARVESEAKGQIIVTARLKHCERTFEVIPRLAISSREPAGDSRDAMRDGGLG